MSDITRQAGKGGSPRNCFSRNFRDNYDKIYGKRKRRTCPHGKEIGDECIACLKAMPPGYLVPLNRKTKTK